MDTRYTIDSLYLVFSLGALEGWKLSFSEVIFLFGQDLTIFQHSKTSKWLKTCNEILIVSTAQWCEILLFCLLLLLAFKIVQFHQILVKSYKFWPCFPIFCTQTNNPFKSYKAVLGNWEAVPTYYKIMSLDLSFLPWKSNF